MLLILFARLLVASCRDNLHSIALRAAFETIENKTTSVTTYFEKLTTGNDVFIVSVIV